MEHQGEAHDSQILIDNYARLQIDLGRSLEHRTPIYLDMNNWIVVGDVARGARRKDTEIQLTQALYKVVREGKAFCPISENTFIELLKQTDPASRIGVARAVDDLSLGVTLIASRNRAATELAHLMYSRLDPRDLHPLRHLVWSRLSFSLGVLYPSPFGVDEAIKLKLQKAHFDHMWVLPLAEMVTQLDIDKADENLRLDNLAQTLNEGNVQHSSEIRSFSQVFKAELSGAVDLVAETAVEISGVIDSNLIGSTPDLTIDQRREYARHWKKLLAAALYKKKSVQRSLATLYIQAALHAAVRWDKKRKLSGNDIHDFGHASGALGYCGAFFTDGPLKRLLTGGPLHLDKLFECYIASNHEEALVWLTQRRLA